MISVDGKGTVYKKYIKKEIFKNGLTNLIETRLTWLLIILF